MKKWIRLEKEAAQLPTSFIAAIKKDLKDEKLRYKYKEELLRNFPGEVGLWLRYHLLKKHFKKIGKNVMIWPGTRIKHPGNVELGNNAQVGYDNHYQATQGIKIGKDTIIGPNVNIWTMNHVYSRIDRPIKDQGYEKKSVEIGENCWITSKCFILPGAKIPNGCVILPNSVVGLINIPPNSVIGGNPAKVLFKRAMLGRFKKYEE